MGCNSSKNVAAAPPKQKREVSAASTQSAGNKTLLSARVAGDQKQEVKRHVDIADEAILTVSFLNGEVCSIVTRLDATLGDVKAKISKETGHSPWSQRLSFGATLLTDSSKPLKDLGVTGASPLSLVVVPEPIGQSSLAAPDGKKGSATKILNEFELMSWQAACAAHKSHSDLLYMEWDGDSTWRLRCDLYWTTRSDGCRYEYWSSDPGDNEYGVLVRIDNEAMIAIGKGSDDGLEIFEEFETNDVIEELIREGWPRPKVWKVEESDDESDEDDE